MYGNGLSRNTSDDRLGTTLYFISFVIHVILCWIADKTAPHPIMMDVANLMTSGYSMLGFRWGGHGSFVVALGVLSSLILNAVRCVIQGMVIGWPRYRHHNLGTFRRSWLRAFGYLALAFLLVAILGEKYSTIDGVMDLSQIIIGTFFVGFIVNVIDDAVSATVTIFRRSRE